MRLEKEEEKQEEEGEEEKEEEEVEKDNWLQQIRSSPPASKVPKGVWGMKKEK